MNYKMLLVVVLFGCTVAQAANQSKSIASGVAVVKTNVARVPKATVATVIVGIGKTTGKRLITASVLLGTDFLSRTKRLDRTFTGLMPMPELALEGAVLECEKALARKDHTFSTVTRAEFSKYSDGSTKLRYWYPTTQVVTPQTQVVAAR